jgi:hypothetical protein
MKTVSFFAFIVIFLNFVSSINAGTITISSSGGAQFATKDGQLLSLGCAVRVGSFNLPNAARDTVLPTKGDYAQLKNVFKPLAEGLTGAGTSTQAAGSGSVLRANSFPGLGDIFGAVENFSASYMPPDTRLYMWVFNHADPDLATQWGLFTADAWLAPPTLGNRTLDTTAVTVLQGSVEDGKLKLIDVPATYGNWAWQSYSVSAAGTVTQIEADPDGDGLANIAEYAWKLNPAARSEARTTLQVASGGATVKFTFKRPRNQPDVAVIAECSSDLSTWQTAPSTLVSSDTDFDTLQCSSISGTRCFWRVRFENVP